MALVKNELNKEVTTVNNLMSANYPSIWLLLNKRNEKGIIIGGVYREWTHNGVKTNEEQMKNMEILTTQIDQAAEMNQNVIILGDVNLCANK